MLPQIVVIGAMKGGTRSLYEYLAAHPDIGMSTPKELDFFSLDEHWDRGVEWYEDHFPTGCPVVGEASPNYGRLHRHPAAPARMASVVPEVRLVYLVRHPVDRIESHYQHEARKGAVRRPIDEEVLADDDYVLTSSYARQLDGYLEHFSREAVLVVPSEHLHGDRIATMADVYRFAGVDPSAVGPEALTTEYSRAADRRVARRATRGLRRHRSVRRALRRVPGPIRRGLAPLGSVASDAPHLRLAEATRTELARRLAPDVARLRAFLPSGHDGWGIAPD